MESRWTQTRHRKTGVGAVRAARRLRRSVFPFPTTIHSKPRRGCGLLSGEYRLGVRVPSRLSATSLRATQHFMPKEPDIVTTGWSEIASSLEATGFFPKDQLNPGVVPRILADLVRRYTTVIGYEGNKALVPLGSGTFLRRTDGQCGVLTAGHVVGAIRHRRNILVLPAQDRDKVTWIRIQAEGMHGWGENNQGPIGPDIGWIPLSAKEADTMEAVGTVFHNRGRRVEPFTGRVCQFSIVFGFVAAASNLDEDTVVAHGLLARKTAERQSNQEGWDYGEYAITNDDAWIPSTHGGVSGSAVWEITLPMDGLGNKAVKPEGVVYAEGPHKDRKFIAHGEQSIRTILEER